MAFHKGGGWDHKKPDKTAFNNFNKNIKTKGFLDDDILGKSEELGKYFAGLKISKTQFRKFFNQFRLLSEKSKAFEPLKIELRIIQSQIAYAVGRSEGGHGSEKLNREFKEFLDNCIQKIISNKNQKSYSDFMKFLEAVYAYFYYYDNRRN